MGTVLKILMLVAAVTRLFWEAVGIGVTAVNKKPDSDESGFDIAMLF